MKRELTFVKNNERVIGTVTKLEEIKDDDGITYLPIFKFKTSKNQDYTYRHRVTSNPAKWSIGDEVKFIYDPNEPTTARLLNYSSIFSWTIILLAFGIDLIVVGIGYYLFHGYF
ncbi:DUF3592 domain-containing protein [Flavobacterium shii]